MKLGNISDIKYFDVSLIAIFLLKNIDVSCQYTSHMLNAYFFYVQCSLQSNLTLNREQKLATAPIDYKCCPIIIQILLLYLRVPVEMQVLLHTEVLLE